MYKYFFLLLLFFNMPAEKILQGDLTIDHLQVDIWPEYDRPDVLVIYRLTLTENSTLPARMTLRIPLEAKAPFNLAIQDTDNRLYNLDYTTNTKGEWIEISFTTPSSTIQMEYYDPRLSKDVTLRSFEYIWAGDYAINSLTVRVQQPINATRMQIIPDLGSGKQEQDGLNYYTALFRSVEMGKTFMISLSYQKPDNTFSSNTQPVQPIQPINQPGEGLLNLKAILPWAMTGIGLLVIISGFFWFYRSGRLKPGLSHPRHRSPQNSDGETGSTDRAMVYCPLCGKRATPGDQFCRSCGARLR